LLDHLHHGSFTRRTWSVETRSITFASCIWVTVTATFGSIAFTPIAVRADTFAVAVTPNWAVSFTFAVTSDFTLATFQVTVSTHFALTTFTITIATHFTFTALAVAVTTFFSFVTFTFVVGDSSAATAKGVGCYSPHSQSNQQDKKANRPPTIFARFRICAQHMSDSAK
jgi:hypothetical protein